MLDSIASWLNDNLQTVAFFLPLLVGLLTKSSLSQQVKAVVMLVITAVTTLVAAQAAGGLDGPALQEWGKSVIVTIAAYYGVWKPLGAGSIGGDQVGFGPKA